MDTFYAPLSVRINRIWLYYSCLQLGLDFSCIGANNKEVSVPCQLTSLPPLNRKASISSEVKHKNLVNFKFTITSLSFCTQAHIFDILVLAVCRMLAYKQALRGSLAAGWEKEGELATVSLEFEYLHGKSWCKILIGGDDISNMMSLPLVHAFACFSIFVYIRP